MSVWSRRRPTPDDDRGMSLAELLVSSAMLAIALPMAGALLVNGLQTERDVRAVNDAGAAAQTVISSVETGVRSAAALQHSTSGTGAADELLVARVTAGVRDATTNLVEDAPVRCVAWFYSADRDVLFTRSVPASATLTAITTPTTAALDAGWTPLAVRVVPLTDGAKVLKLADNRWSVDLAFSVGTGTERPAVTMSTTVVRRPQSDTKGAPCF